MSDKFSRGKWLNFNNFLHPQAKFIDELYKRFLQNITIGYFGVATNELDGKIYLPTGLSITTYRDLNQQSIFG